MPAPPLEIALVTYNRAEDLRLTLRRVSESPFAGCRITVYDNHSTDGTPAVCAQAAAWLADLHVVRHARNLGAGPNYLAAVQAPTAPYVWVLADDDDYDWSDCDDVVEALEEGAVDLISVGAPGREDWPAGRTTMHALLAQGARVFHVFTFLPNTIMRTATYDDASIADGYRFVDDLYPHFPHIRRMVQRDATVHVSRTQLVSRRAFTVPVSPLFWQLRWARCCQSIEDRALRRKVLYGTSPTRARWVMELAAGYAQDRLYYPERVGREAGEMAVLLDGWQRFWAIACLPILLLPSGVQRLAKQALRRKRGVPYEEGIAPQYGTDDERR